MKIYLDSVGCRLNQAEIELYARQFRAAGHELTGSAEEADLAVINTCAVTSAAVSDSRHKVRQVGRAGAAEIIVTGCWATLKPQDAAALPGVEKVIPNTDKDRLAAEALDLPLESFDLEPIERTPLPGARLRTRAFIKVQDGCDNRCTFCVTTLARGPGRSRSVAEILADIRAAVEAKEIVLTGVHLGSWGHDLSPRMHLSHLVKAILEYTDAPRLRLSSLEPWDLDAEFFRLWENPRLCRHLHLPLQSGCAATLRRMARKTTPESFAALVTAARQVMPDVAITTDIITGFPGESEDEFRESLDFVRSMRFAGGHVFTYSLRPGTAAARMSNQIPFETRKERNAQMRHALAEAERAYQTGFIGAVLPVLWESAARLGPNGWEMSGLSGNYLRVNATAPRALWNQITPVRVTGLAEQQLQGSILSC
ncbi:MAG: MiaB/RimO family radical SAM methylthiotransferase [Anaerolineales bacterium]|nr:MiaB/RimO family radical SAM methylthiotransferase [Anaerolineales bacterium]